MGESGVGLHSNYGLQFPRVGFYSLPTEQNWTRNVVLKRLNGKTRGGRQTNEAGRHRKRRLTSAAQIEVAVQRDQLFYSNGRPKYESRQSANRRRLMIAWAPEPTRIHPVARGKEGADVMTLRLLHIVLLAPPSIWLSSVRGHRETQVSRSHPRVRDWD